MGKHCRRWARERKPSIRASRQEERHAHYSEVGAPHRVGSRPSADAKGVVDSLASTRPKLHDTQPLTLANGVGCFRYPPAMGQPAVSASRACRADRSSPSLLGHFDELTRIAASFSELGLSRSQPSPKFAVAKQ